MKDKLKSIFKNNYIIVLADQAINSGSNFVLAILYARCLGPQEFGKYGLILFIGYLINMIGQNTIGTPMAINIHKYKINHYNYQIYILSKYFIVLFFIFILIYGIKQIGFLKGNIFIIFLFLSLFFLYDIIKKYLFAIFKHKIILLMDIILFSIIFLQLYFLYLNLTYIKIFEINSLAFFIALVIAFCSIKIKFKKIQVSKIVYFYKNEWQQIKHLFISALLQWFNSRIGFYLLAYLYSAKLVGIINGYMSIVGIFNPLFISLDNYVLPKASNTYYYSSLEKTQKFINNIIFILIFPISIISSFLIFYRNEIILYMLGEDYIEYNLIFIFIVFTYILNFLTKKYIYIANILKKQFLFSKVAIYNFIITVTFSYLLIYFFNIYGLVILLFVTSVFNYIYLRSKI